MRYSTLAFIVAALIVILNFDFIFLAGIASVGVLVTSTIIVGLIYWFMSILRGKTN